MFGFNACKVVRMGDLALKVGQVHSVVVHQSDVAHPCASEVHGRWRPQATRTNHQRVALQKSGLAFEADVVQQDVARIAQQFLVTQATPRHGAVSLL